jgi:hypothetical protein
LGSNEGVIVIALDALAGGIVNRTVGDFDFGTEENRGFVKLQLLRFKKVLDCKSRPRISREQ